MAKLLIVAVAMAAFGLGGCIVHGRPGHAHVHGPTVVFPVAHVHSHSCGHYYHEGGWRHSHDHVHAHGCGHQFSGGVWIVGH
jgi:hypothetical protein